MDFILVTFYLYCPIILHPPKIVYHTSLIIMKARAYGCLYGAFIGDALGSISQSLKTSTVQASIDAIMSMPGGGNFKLVPGQVTDDSQMAMSIIHAFLADPEQLKADMIAEMYHLWCHSKPFDIGIPTKTVLDQFQTPTAQELKNKSIKLNSKSQSNVCLMRATPLAVYSAFRNLSEAQTRMIAQADTCLTHSHQICIQAVQLYVLSLSEIIRGYPAKEAYQNHKQRVSKGVLKDWQKEYVDNSKKRMIFDEKIGWLKIAWTQTFRWLKHYAENKLPHQNLYSITMKDIIWHGGDTDTNACIVGGMVGAMLGEENIPGEYKKKLLGCQTKRMLTRQMPLHPKIVEIFINTLDKR